MSGEELIVRKIKEGTVIDHIPAGRALAVLRILGITGREGFRVAVVMNADSKKLGKKDIVKIEGRELRGEEVDLIALIAPEATINIIRDFKVVEKRKAVLPEKVKGLIECINPTCITRKEREPVKPVFTVVSRFPVILRCDYCGTYISENEILRQYGSA